MKNITLFLFSFLFGISLEAQSPQMMSYQAVIRDNSNVLVINQSIGMQVSILQGSPTGNAIFVELQSVTSNSNGLVSLEIGNGTPLTGSFSSIDWADGPYFIKTETDITRGTNYSIIGTFQLLSVPYALYAENAIEYQSGTGISISGNIINNSAPHVPTTINGSGGTNVSGVSPNYTISTPRIIAGTTSGGFAPTTITGSGFTVQHIGTGSYVVNFSTPFSSTPSAVVSLYDTQWLDCGAVITDISPTSMSIKTGKGEGNTNYTRLNSLAFSFVVVGE
jgi:hypothetical protein